MTDSGLVKLLEKSNTRVVDQRVHGGKNAFNLVSKNKILDFSVSINPFGPPATTKFNVTVEDMREYPDPTSNELKSVLAKMNGVDEEKIFIGNGSAEIIALLFFIFVRKGDTILSLWPSFGDYYHYSLITRSKFVRIKLDPPHFKLRLDKAFQVMKKYKPKLFFLCNPNNPTGSYSSEEEILALLKHVSPESLFILDEAYVNFVLSSWNSVKLLSRFKNLIILRSLTKDYAIAGLRLGYSIASKDITDLLRSAAPSWNINALAQSNGVNIFKDKNFLKRTVPLIHHERKRIFNVLQEFGYQVVPSATNFYLLKVRSAKTAANLLLSKKIYVRNCTSLGLPQYLRISIRLPEENGYLMKVLDELSDRIKL